MMDDYFLWRGKKIKDEFHINSADMYEKEVLSIPFDRLPLYLDHPYAYVRFAAKARLANQDASWLAFSDPKTS